MLSNNINAIPWGSKTVKAEKIHEQKKENVYIV